MLCVFDNHRKVKTKENRNNSNDDDNNNNNNNNNNNGLMVIPQSGSYITIPMLMK